VFKLMAKDSIEGEIHRTDGKADEVEQIVYNGKKKMVLDHLVVQNLGKDNEEEDVSSMLLAGAKALYETNADGVSASDISYTPKQVEEMLDKVEKQAEEEAVLYQQKWDKDDAMTEDERLAALNTKGSETMNFAFAKIWEMDKGELEEVDGGGDMEEDMDDNWMTVFENAEKERARKEAEEIQNKKERRKRIDYGFDDTPKKKNGKSKTTKSKDRSRETSIIRQYQSSDSEFHIGTGEVSADDSTDLEVIPEAMSDLTNGPRTSLPHDGTMKKKKSELSKMERRALRKRLEDEMIRKAAIIQIQATTDSSEAGPSTTSTTVPAQTSEEAYFTDLANRRNNLNKIEKTALRKYLNEKVKAAQPPRPRKSKSKTKSASPTKRTDPGPSTAPAQSNEDTFLADLIHRPDNLSEEEQQAFLKCLNDKIAAAQSRPGEDRNEAGPSTQAWPNMTGHIMTTNGQFSEVQKQKSNVSDPRVEAMASWAQNALKKKADVAARAELRKELERSLQAARQAHQQAGQMLDRQNPPATGERDAFTENLIRIQRQAELEVREIQRKGEENAMEASKNAVPSVPPPSASRPDLAPQPATSNTSMRPTPGYTVPPPPSASTSTSQQHQPALVQPARIVSQQGEIANLPPSSATSNTSIRPTTNNTMHPPPSASISTSQTQRPALVQMASTARKQGEIAKAQELIVWLWHHLTEFGLRKEIKLWAKMTLSEVPSNERRSIYSTLAKIVDHLLRNTGHLAYYTDPRHKHCLQVLFDEAAPGVGHGGLVPKMPTGFGRLIGPPSQSNGQATNIPGPSRPSNGNNGPASVPSIPQLDPSTIARPAAPLVTPQQRAAIARSAIPPAGAQVVTQPRQTSNSASNHTSTQATSIPCPFCGKLNHNATTCPERQQRPLGALRKTLEAYHRQLAANPPSSRTTQQSNKIVCLHSSLFTLVRADK
jgi:hypothetical protein